MNADNEVLLNLINAFPEAALVLSKQRGKIIAANGLFSELTGFAKDALISSQLINLSFLTRDTRHGLVRLFVQALRGEEQRDVFRFQYAAPDKSVHKLAARARPFNIGDGRYVLFVFNGAESSTEGCKNELDESWEAYMRLSYEPYMEFTPSTPLLPPLDRDRSSFLKMAGELLHVKHANQAAINLFFKKDALVWDRNFASFFYQVEDSYRFLDMLAVVGQLKAESAMITAKGNVIEAELNCQVKFDKFGAIVAVYCSQKILAGLRHYEAILGGSRVEMDFTFNQPFTGLAFMTPTDSLDANSEPDEDELEAILDSTLVTRANQAMVEIYGMDKAQFLMKPLKTLFPDVKIAKEVISDLLTSRSSSVEIYDGDKLDYVAILKGMYDDASRMTGILMAASRYPSGYKARHSNKKSSDSEPQGTAVEDSVQGNKQH